MDDVRVYASRDDATAKKEQLLESAVSWWAAPKERRAEALLEYAKSLVQDSEDRRQADIRHARLYENVELNSLVGRDFAQNVVRQALLHRGLVSLNVVAACTDTLAAKVGKNKPFPRFLTSGAQWKMQMKARRLDKFIRGLFWELKSHEVAKAALFDALIFGTGFLYVYGGHDNRLCLERVIPSEVYIDDEDGRYGEPRQVLRRKMVAREVLLAWFPEKSDEIMRAGTGNSVEPSSESKSHAAATPMVEVWEGWHLPSSPGAGDGKHIIAINGCELWCEPWKADVLPFIPLHFKKRVVGFWGKGVAESLVGIQLELNRLIQSISEQLRRKGRGRIFVQLGSKVQPENLTNRVADIVYYTGQPPVVDSSSVVGPDEFAQVDRLYQRAYQEVGVSELAVSSRKPSGLNAAVALREFSDIESERFALLHQMWEQTFMSLAEVCISLIRDQYGWSGYRTAVLGRRKVDLVDWKDINLKRDSYFMQVFPVSALPQYPAARYDKVKEMLADGFVDKPTAQRLLEFPDLEAETNLGNASMDDADATLSLILDSDSPPAAEDVVPEEYQNKELLLNRALAAYLFVKHFPDVEEWRLQMLREVIDMLTRSMAPPPPPLLPMDATMPPAPLPAPPPEGAAVPPPPAV